MDQLTKKMELHYCGHRFGNHKLPLSFFNDLSKLNSLVTNLAAGLYLEDHPDRKRVPKGFKDKVQLSLSEIKEGSAVLSLTPSYYNAQTSLIPTNEEDYTAKAFELLVDEMSGFCSSYSNEKFSSEINSFLSTFGSDLQDDEKIEFIESEDKKSTFNSEYRKSLKSQVKEYDEQVEFYGIISEVNAKNKTFIVSLKTDDKVQDVSVAGVSKEILLEAGSVLNSYNNGRKVYITGNGHYKSGILQSITKVDELCILEYNDVQSRLDELSHLKDGWGENGDGKSLSAERLRTFSQLFDDFYWSDSVLPYIYPTLDGNLEFEWSINEEGFILSMDLATFDCELITPNEEMEFSLENKEGWDLLNNTLRGASHGD